MASKCPVNRHPLLITSSPEIVHQAFHQCTVPPGLEEKAFKTTKGRIKKELSKGTGKKEKLQKNNDFLVFSSFY